MTISWTNAKSGALDVATAARALGLAASPTFALLAALAAQAPAGFCSAAHGATDLTGMTTMYALMAVFHLPPWLRWALASTRSKGE